jgi:class 3 adenylate cyclase
MPTPLKKQLREKELTLFVSILAFETYWAYYSMSSGKVYMKETKEAAKNLLDSLDDLAKSDNGILDYGKYKISKTDAAVIENILHKLREWVDGALESPYYPLIQSKVMLWLLFTQQKVYLAKHLGLQSLPLIALSSDEFLHTERYLRWQPHLPKESMWEYDQTLDIPKFATSQTIAVYGDIRRSQDLMIYTIVSERFEDMMIKFFESVRDLFDKNLGIFDKFTGDGFLGYFNEYLCSTRGKDFVECFLKFSRQCTEFCEPLFDEWKKYVRKLPDQDIMLSMGADVGEIYFGDRHGHLVYIGDAIVWAQRMCSAAPASTIYVNNLLANLLANKNHIKLLPVKGKTKTGETFQASKLRLLG